MKKEEIISNFNPSDAGVAGSTIFGLPFTKETAELIIIPIPWDVTVSFREGTVFGANTVFDCSKQVDLFDEDVPDAWKMGVFMHPISEHWLRRSKYLRQKAKKIIKNAIEENDIEKNRKLNSDLKKINIAGEKLKEWVKKTSEEFLQKNKIVAVLGGDHSSPLGLIEALSSKYNSFGILQIDAHMDLRNAYEGFDYSHASIMYNSIKNKSVTKLVQVGIRDYCEEEFDLMKKSQNRIITYFDYRIKEEQFKGKTWDILCKEIVSVLPENVYVSFDIDGLDPSNCPNTGTPVAGGLSYSEAIYLLKFVVNSGRKIIGFDLCEVSPGKARHHESWDGIVGAKLLYKLCNLAGKSLGKL